MYLIKEAFGTGQDRGPSDEDIRGKLEEGIEMRRAEGIELRARRWPW
jgi:hypothetical protein